MFNVKYYKDMDNLLDELNYEILNHMNIQDLYVCRATCKLWYSHFDNITFKCKYCNKLDLLKYLSNFGELGHIVCHIIHTYGKIRSLYSDI